VFFKSLNFKFYKEILYNNNKVKSFKKYSYFKFFFILINIINNIILNIEINDYIYIFNNKLNYIIILRKELIIN
jgi:hypothetical protein